MKNRSGKKSPVGKGNGHTVPVSETSSESFLSRFLNYTLMPIFLMLATPSLVMVLWYAERFYHGSFYDLGQAMASKGFLPIMADMWRSVTFTDPVVASIIGGYCVFQVILMKILPGPIAYGPVTPKGNTPVYVDNGFACYVVTMATFIVGTFYLKQHGMSPTIVYDRWGDFQITVTVFSLIFCAILTVKGLWAPTTSDHGSTGNLIFDYYWGTELYPRIFGIDVKVFTNCRFGMTVWPLLVCIYAVKSYELHGFVDSIWVSCFLQMVYFTKFFWWEAGYMRTIDIMVDRAGYYICWGCLCYVPGLYASVSLYLVNNPVQLGSTLSTLIAVAGLASIAINYLADWQKQAVRDSDGQCLIWGKKPEVIRAKYVTEDGRQRESLLLVSGWWGVARHFHYVPELMLAFLWSVPALFQNCMPYFYVIFLFFLLTHRTFRDDVKCAKKYKVYWKQYCERVPYKMVPGIF